MGQLPQGRLSQSPVFCCWHLFQHIPK